MTTRIHSVTVEHDTACARRVRGATDLDRGLVAIGVPADLRRSYELSWELLGALGKLRGVSGAGKHDDINWDVLTADFLAHGVRHLVVVDAQWLGAKHLGTLCGLALVTGADLWLIAHLPVDDTYPEALADWPAEPSTIDDLEALFGPGVQPEGSEAGEAEVCLPPLPRDSFLTFRAACRDGLDAESFARVDAAYRRAFDLAGVWWAGADEAPDEDVVLGALRRSVHECATVEEMTVAVRAFQAASYHANWLVSVDLVRFIITAETAEAAAVHAPTTWTRLRAYREPYRGAACALVACDLGIETLLGVRVGQVAADGVTVSSAGVGRELAVPGGAAVFLSAQRWYRLLQGATSDELLFAEGDAAMGAKYLADAVRAPVLEIGVPLYSQRVARAELDPKQWTRRWGISVQELR